MHDPTRVRSRLVVIPLPDGTVIDRVSSGIGLLARRRAWTLLSGVFARREDDGRVVITEEIDVAGVALPPTRGRGWWSDTLSSLLGAPPANDVGRAVAAGATAVLARELSPSFVDEVRESVGSDTSLIALVVDLIDPGAVGRELSRIDTVRAIYGILPPGRAEGA